MQRGHIPTLSKNKIRQKTLQVQAASYRNTVVAGRDFTVI